MKSRFVHLVAINDNMSEILHVTQENLLLQRKFSILHLEEKLCRYNLHRELLLNYKKNRKYPKGMSLKFNPSLCNDEATDKLCRNILRKASFRIRDIMLDAVSKKIENLKSEKNNLFRTFKENTSSVEFGSILKYVQPKVQKLSKDIKSRHLRKYERDRIKIIESACRNRRFRKRKRKRHNKERKKDWLEKKR